MKEIVDVLLLTFSADHTDPFVNLLWCGIRAVAVKCVRSFRVPVWLSMLNDQIFLFFFNSYNVYLRERENGHT